MMNEYLKELTNKGLITTNNTLDKKKTYSITNKGYEYIKDYKKITEIIKKYEL